MAAARQNTYAPIPFPKCGNPNARDLVELVFDKFSPRPHFIVRQTNGNVSEKPQSKEIDETMTLVTKFLRNRPEYDNQAILSFHRGCWYQEHNTPWHCHLCVPMEEYCHEAEAVKELGKTYVKNIGEKLQSTKQKYRKYQEKTVSTVKSLNSISFNLKSYEQDGIGLVWMTPAPRIGIYSQQPQRLRSLYNFMVNVNEKMENDLSQRDKSFNNFGCHFCLFVSASSQESTTVRQCNVLNETGEGIKTQGLVGYIQMDDQQYYQLLPDENHRRFWFSGFKNHDFLVIT